MNYKSLNHYFHDTLNKMKTVAIVAMLFIHSLLFYSMYNHIEKLPELSLKTQFILVWSLFSMSIPAIAGAELRLRLSDGALSKDKLRKIKSKSYLKILIILVFIEFLKSIVASGYEYGFRWDVLPMIGVSYIIISQLVKLCTVKTIFFITPLFFLADKFLKNLLDDFVIISEYQSIMFTKSSYGLIYSIFYAFLTSTLIWWVARKIIFGRAKNKIVLISIYIVALINAYLFVTHWNASAKFASAIWNFPFSVITEFGEVGGHIWAVFPWSGLVLIGFLYQHVLENKNLFFLNMWHFSHLIVLIAFLTFIYFFTFHFEYFYRLLSPDNYFSARVFEGGGKLAMIVSCYYICFHYLTYQLSKVWPTEKNILIKICGSGILIIYVIHYVIAAKFAVFFSNYFQNQVGVLGFFIFVMAVSFGISAFLIYLYQSRLTINVKKINN